MMGRTLITYATETGINAQVASTISEVLKTEYDAAVTVADLKESQPDITPYENIIVGAGVHIEEVYTNAIEFLGKNFEGKNVALYFSCEDWENPKIESTEENTKKALAKNPSLKPVDVAAFGGCKLRGDKPMMDEQNTERVKDWAMKLGKMFEQAETGGGIFEIHADANGKFRFHLKAANGEIIAQSQAYQTKQGAENGIESVRKNAATAKVVFLEEKAD